ncbi:hypothetical protein P7C73_g6421, partial [Tremellales sp. Uapishka_1]
KSAASAALSTATDLANTAATSAQNLATQAINSDAAANVSAQAKNLGVQAGVIAGQAGSQASVLASQAHAQAHALAPSVVPAPGTITAGVDESHDVDPKDKVGAAKIEKLFDSRPSAEELQDKGILKGAPDDSLSGKKADLQKAMLEDKLDAELASRPAAEDLVKKGILSREFRAAFIVTSTDETDPSADEAPPS